jgi:hypothetical protein
MMSLRLPKEGLCHEDVWGSECMDPCEWIYTLQQDAAIYYYEIFGMTDNSKWQQNPKIKRH